MKIKTDSRKVNEGDTFVALRGINDDGHNYVEDAIKNGAKLVVVEEGNYSVDTLVVENTHEYLVEYLKETYYDKLKDLKIIGMTGTNGKTTSCFILASSLNKLGIKSGYIGTIGFYIGDKKSDLLNTTPDILEIYNMLLECIDAECKYVVMEVSSQALDMHRVDGILFDYAVFTNLTKDHLDYHKTMEKYAFAKQKLFKQIKENGYAIINIDDQYNKKFLLSDNNNVTYGFGNAGYKIDNYEMLNDLSNFDIIHDEITEKYESSLLGKYNIYNLSVMIIILKLIGFDYQNISDCVKKVSAPSGRMETIIHGTNKIIVDYAHTPDATKKIIEATKQFCKGRIITIIGCGGNRDKTKRPEMGFIATNLSDEVIFTSDNPRNEEPMNIINDIVQSLDKKNYKIELNRKEAIKKGIQMLQDNDILLVLGKGHENYQIIGNKKIYFSDKETILDILRR